MINQNTESLIKVIQDIAANTSGSGGVREKRGVILEQALLAAIPGGDLGYNVYIAAVLPNAIDTSSGFLVEGTKYVIWTGNEQAGDIFTNVGFVALDIPFVATGTTPTDWTNGTIVTNVTPTVEVLENTTGEIFTWDFSGAYDYFCAVSGSILVDGKTIIFSNPLTTTAATPTPFVYRTDDDTLDIQGGGVAGIKMSLEVRIYP